MSEELDNIITLTDENGQEVRFEFLDLVNYQGRDYVVLLPAEEEAEDEAEEVVILGVQDSDDGETETYTSVEDEDVLQAVFELFKERFQDEFSFVDE